MKTIRPSPRFSFLVVAAAAGDKVTAAAIMLAEAYGVLSVAELQEHGLWAVRILGEDLARTGGDEYLSDAFLADAIVYTACKAMAAYATQLSRGQSRRRVVAIWSAIRASYAWVIH